MFDCPPRPPSGPALVTQLVTLSHFTQFQLHCDGSGIFDRRVFPTMAELSHNRAAMSDDTTSGCKQIET
ncbi:hypothetical protein HanIR_Chr01g0044841 [Helianthus annuus]|nr:hypothetical protein HanIR_Chr01g0044841 [Helianthus annuus]